MPAASPEDPRRRRASLALVFVTVFGSCAYLSQPLSWNSRARFAQARSLLSTGSWAINGAVTYRAVETEDGLQPRRLELPPAVVAWVPLRSLSVTTLDVAVHEGRIYPNKPPGATLLALPGHALALGLTRLRGWHDDDWQALAASAYLTCVLSNGLLTALTVVVFAWLQALLFPALDPRARIAACLGLGLATPLWAYGTLLYDHVPVACCLLLAFTCLVAAREEPPSRRRDGLWVVAGLACGLAVVCNYVAALPTVVFLIYAAVTAGAARRRALALLIGGGAPWALLLLVYHAQCFGSPWATANTYQPEEFEERGRLLGMLGVPNPIALWGLTGSGFRGLFFSAPLLLLGPLGLRVLARQGRRAEAAVAVAVVGLYLLVATSFNGWHGGDGFTARYLVPAVPFLALGLGPLYLRWPRTAAALSGVSLLMIASALVVNPEVPDAFFAPFQDYVWPVLLGLPFHTAQGPMSLPPVSAGIGSVHDLALPAELGAHHWASFNLGELVWPRSRWSLVPLVLWIAAGVTLCLRQADRSSRIPEASPSPEAAPDEAAPDVDLG